MTSENLQQRLNESLKARLDLSGSPEYALTLKHWDIESGPQIFAARASARRISDSDCTSGLFGWPTPNTMPDAPNMSENRGDGHRQRMTPQSVAGLVGWPTPAANEFEPTNIQAMVDRRERLKTEHGNGNGFGLTLGQSVAVNLSGWTTPQAHDALGSGSAERLKRHGTKHGCSNLQDQIHLAGWATASARDWKDTPGMNQHGTNPDGSDRQRLDQLPRQVHGLIPTSSTASTGRKGALAPQMSRWLQGFPAIWDSLSPMYENWQQVQDAIAKADSMDMETR